VRTRTCDVLVIGGGPAGLAAAHGAASAGAEVLLAERDFRLGGILNQCVHDGFGIELFGESLTGPEFASRMVARLDGLRVGALLSTSAAGLAGDLSCRLTSRDGYQRVQPRAVVLAMGCAERPFGALAVPGTRPAGIWAAGAAQRLVNVDGLMVGRRAVVLGSGDVGLIMSRRMVLEGAEVACVVERMPYPGGLPRNVVQCLNDFGIPLLLRHTVTEVRGARGSWSATRSSSRWA
jgi:NADPH-dependent 2,4-dienoyl-CoA reductase/sulfur reductase-like enzyme